MDLLAMATITVAVSALLLGVGYALGHQSSRPPVQLVARVDSLDVPPPVVAEPRPTEDLLDDFPDDTPPPPRGGSGQACACCCHCCHPPTTTGRWTPPEWLKTEEQEERQSKAKFHDWGSSSPDLSYLPHGLIHALINRDRHRRKGHP